MVKGTAELQRPVPLYMQVTRQLRAQIASGELAEGERIPSQREMMQIWRISMQTASKVIGALKTQGLAIPSVGRDTIVAPGATARIAAAAESTTQAVAEPAVEVSHEVRAIAEMTAAPAYVAAILGIPARRRALRRRETHLDNGKPVRVTATWLPSAITDELPRLFESKSLPAGALAYIAEATGNRAARVTEGHAAIPADTDTAEAFDVALNSPILVARRQHHMVSGRLIAYTETLIPGGIWDSRCYVITGA